MGVYPKWLEAAFCLAYGSIMLPASTPKIRVRSLWSNSCAPSCSFGPALILGDSHARVFTNRLFSRCGFDVVAIRGASAYGLKNPDSSTGAGQRFMEAVRDSRLRRVLVLLGGVDTDFLIWHRADRTGRPVAVCFEDSLAAYRNFLHELLEERDAGEIMVISAPLPTVRDDSRRNEILNGRAVVADLRQKTELTMDFNSRIGAFCRCRGIAYLDLDPLSAARDGLVTKALRSQRRRDHHYHQGRYARLIVSALEPDRSSGRTSLFYPDRMPVAAFCLSLLLLLGGCVSTATGEKKFDPWEAAMRADDKVNELLENMDYPTSSTRQIYE